MQLFHIYNFLFVTIYSRMEYVSRSIFEWINSFFQYSINKLQFLTHDLLMGVYYPIIVDILNWVSFQIVTLIKVIYKSNQVFLVLNGLWFFLKNSIRKHFVGSDFDHIHTKLVQFEQFVTNKYLLETFGIHQTLIISTL